MPKYESSNTVRASGVDARSLLAGIYTADSLQDALGKRAELSAGESIVTREVIRIITPGTFTEDSLLDARAANYLACLTNVGDDLRGGGTAIHIVTKEHHGVVQVQGRQLREKLVQVTRVAMDVADRKGPSGHENAFRMEVPLPRAKSRR